MTALRNVERAEDSAARAGRRLHLTFALLSQEDIGTPANALQASPFSRRRQPGSRVRWVRSAPSVRLEALLDATEEGLGTIVDADMARAGAAQTSVGVRRELAAQALSIANNAPRVLLDPFQ